MIYPLALVAGAGFFLLGASQAAVVTTGVNLVVNGDAETGTIDGWIGNATVISSAPEVYEGSYSFGSGTGPATETLEQTIDLSDLLALISTGTAQYNLSAQLQNRSASGVLDSARLSLQFFDVADAQIGSTVTLTDPTSTPYAFSLETASDLIPATAQYAVLRLVFNRTGFSSTDAYADDISFSIVDTSEVPVPGAMVLMLTALTGGTIARRAKKAR
ncbi:hypothetical protein [Parvularcula sp. LCG005]|uniref:hypothetical protein n=1 Tax=Parvularcula sp. LCG005 TaxID=3078805 RepID=UPI0029429475|nr:hypothetical protein [Parvularcula sp. LCG005]WOI53886.1 hypothetical protein RUI03_02525 [Parvularcula sp. LCG005]